MADHPAAAVAARSWFAGAAITSLGAGHIHDTYLVVTPRDRQRYVLQRINEAVFADADLLMRQTQRLLGHLGGKYPFRVPRLVDSNSGNAAERVDGGLWRVWSYLAHTSVVGPVSTPAQAAAVGHAFGTLQASLADLPEPKLQDTIDGFLQLDHYLAEFDAVAGLVGKDVPQRERRRLLAQVDDARPLAERFRERNTHIHGDCKVDNLLFDERGEQVVAIIDFDTAMYGHWAWDFGDLARSIEFSHGGVDLRLFGAAVSGYLRGCGAGDRVPADFVAAPRYVAAMLGVRFLTDHLRGDVYFKVGRRGDNLRRAQEQFALCSAFTGTQETLAVVDDAFRSRATPG